MFRKVHNKTIDDGRGAMPSLGTADDIFTLCFDDGFHPYRLNSLQSEVFCCAAGGRVSRQSCTLAMQSNLAG